MFTPQKELIFTDCFDHNTLICSGPAESTVIRSRESHWAREVLLVLEGATDFFLNGRYYKALPGSAFFMDHWVPHQLGYPADVGRITHIWVHLHESRMFALPSRREGKILQEEPCIVWEYPSCMLDLINARWDQASYAQVELRTALYRSMARLLYEEICFQSSEGNLASKREESIVSFIRNYIVMNHGRNASLEELEKRTGYNRRHLMRRFKEECSMTIGEYIDCVRRGFVSVAGDRMTQKEIAFQLGFKSPAAYWLWKKRDQEKLSGRKKE